MRSAELGLDKMGENIYYQIVFDEIAPGAHKAAGFFAFNHLFIPLFPLMSGAVFLPLRPPCRVSR